MFLLDAVLPPGAGIVDAMRSIGPTALICGALAIILIVIIIFKKRK